MDVENLQELGDHIKRLEDQTQPSKHDTLYSQILGYLNSVLSKFGRERVYLVGSTAEKSKLTFLKDDGDADFLIVSGKLEVPAENLEMKEDNPCSVWIKSDAATKELDMDIIDGKYVSARMLRELRPELYTLLRASHAPFTSNFHHTPGFKQNSIIITVPSKVGLASTKYRGLKLQEDVSQIPYKAQEPKTNMLQTRSYRSIKIHPSDLRALKRLMKITGIARIPLEGKHRQSAFLLQEMEKIINNTEIGYTMQGSKGSQSGNIQGKQDFNKLKLTEGHSNSIYNNDLDVYDEDPAKVQSRYKATCTKIKHRDFVPAIRIRKGELEFVKQWKERVEKQGWPVSKIDELLHTDIFVVARLALINPNVEKDFCLSFNLWEQKIVRGMTTVQRRVYLMLKAYLKGTFERKHAEIKREPKLKTYHMKTLLFWQYEEKNDLYATDTTESVYKVLKASLQSLRRALEVRRLRHYFIPSCNLFLDFEAEDFRILIDCVDTVMCNPNDGLKEYFECDQKATMEVWLTHEEVSCYLQMLNDEEGRLRHLNKIEEVVYDIFRASDESRKDEEGRAPIKEAILDTCKLYLDDEKRIDSELLKEIFSQIPLFLDEKKHAGLMMQYNRIKRDHLLVNPSVTDENEMINFVISSLEYIPENKRRDVIRAIAKRCGLGRLFQQSSSGPVFGRLFRWAMEWDADFNKDFASEILRAIDRFLLCSDKEEAEAFITLMALFLRYYMHHDNCSRLSRLQP